MSVASNAALSTGLWVRTQSLFDAALELPRSAREDFLNAQCTDAPLIREAVLRLLQVHDELGDDDAVPGAGVIDRAVRQWTDHPALPPGTRVGDFTVVRELGVGGMGVVYLAERDIDGQAQRVALKLAQARDLGIGLIDRLRRERGILAGLEHPNIARLIDAGELDDGTPYFAMEYVEGISILQYANEHHLATEARLRLLLQVVDAVQHAHLNLIVHRDIKSANVLITASGTAKLLDFGIAKPLRHAEDLTLTADTQRFFSPMSAAPEQVQGAPTGVGTDVYALGVLAYELLAGTTPFDFAGLRPGEIEQRIIDVVPPLPSQSLQALAQRDAPAALSLATARGMNSATALCQRLRDDLDAIVALALRKLPRERYASAEALGRDLRAALECRPIAQRMSDRSYRLRKFVRRQRLPLALGALAVILLVAFIVTTIAQSRRIAVERDLAQARQRQAEDERNRSEQVSKFLVGLFRASDPENSRGREITARELLERGAKNLDRELQQQPKIRAALMATIGDIYLALNDLDGAQRFVDQAAALREADATENAPGLVDSRRQQAQLALALGHHADALSRVDQALSQAVPDAEPTWDVLQPLRAQALQAGGRVDEAIALWRLVRTHQTQLHGAAAAKTLGSTRQLAYALRAKGEPQQALALLSESFAAGSAALSPDDPELAHLLHHRALLAIELEDFASAERDALQAAAIYSKVFGEAHSNTAGIYNTLGIIADGRHDDPAAVEHFEHALKIKLALYGRLHPKIASAEYNIGTLLHLTMGDAKRAEPHLRAAAEIAIAVLPDAHRNRAEFRLAWGRALRDLGQTAAAEREIRAALDVFEAHPAPRGVDIASAKGELACLHLAMRRTPAAMEDLHQAAAVLEKYLNADDPKRLRLAACSR